MLRVAFGLSAIVLLAVVIIVKTTFFTGQNPIISPLPSYLTGAGLVAPLDIWKPQEQDVLATTIEKPEVKARAAYIYDFTNEEVLYEKNSRQRLPIASLAKIATAILTLESKDPNTRVIISETADAISESSMGITAGEIYTLEELLYGLLLVSGNDAAEAIAEVVSGTSAQFVSEMNNKAKALGLTDTLFINPSGLEAENSFLGEYSSAYDLVTLTKYAMSLPLFAKIVGTIDYAIPFTSEHKYLYFASQTSLLRTYPGVKGVKTGFTDSAGYCLITYAENGGHKILGIILGSDQPREDMRNLLDYSFVTLGVDLPRR